MLQMFSSFVDLSTTLHKTGTESSLFWKTLTEKKERKKKVFDTWKTSTGDWGIGMLQKSDNFSVSEVLHLTPLN